MKVLENFLYFENSRIGVNKNEVEIFRIGDVAEHVGSGGGSINGITFEMKSGNLIIVKNKWDIKDFTQDYLQQ